jgi:Tfp pilus assembly protein PilF
MPPRLQRRHPRVLPPLHPGCTLRLVTALTIALLAATVAAEDPGVTVDALIARGEAQLAEQDIDAAIATLTQAVEAEPDSALVHTRLGGAYLLGGRYTEAIGQFQQAIGIDPQNTGAFIGMGMAYLHGGQRGPAKASFAEAKRLDPSRSDDLDALIKRIDDGATTTAHPPH